MTEASEPNWNRTSYLALPSISEFATWTAAILRGDVLRNSYVVGRSAQRWQCKSLRDAAKEYCWPIGGRKEARTGNTTSFEENYRKLMRFRSNLQRSLGCEDGGAACEAARLAVLQWGETVRWNDAWLSQKRVEKGQNLLTYMRSTRAMLGRSDLSLDHPDLPSLRSNAGFTKIYSLLVDGFVIYDSRVAAALTWLVLQFCHSRGHDKVPTELRFCTMPFQATKRRKRRNPSEAPYKFPNAANGVCHLRSNLMANWLLVDVLNRYGGDMNEDPQRGLRELEAALFMVGYDLTGATLDVSQIPRLS